MESKKKKFDVLFKAVYYAFFGALGIIALFLILTLIPGVGDFKVLIVRSGSMEPTIHTGSVVVVKPSKSYQTGDIVTFGVNESKEVTSITHRITQIETEDNGTLVYHTKGDANEDEDQGIVSSSRIWGKVALTIPYIGYGVEAARKPIGFFFIIVVPSALVIIDEGKKIILEIMRLKKQKKESVITEIKS